MEELIDEVDPAGNFVAVRPRSQLKKQMFMHRAVLIIPKAPDDLILLSKRAKYKHPFPDVWCCAVGGKVSHGETDDVAAIREMEEEIGKPYPVRKVTTFVYNKSDYMAIFTVFTTTTPVLVEDLIFDPEEIQYSKAFSKEEVKRMIKERPNEFAPTFIAAIKASIDLL